MSHPIVPSDAQPCVWMSAGLLTLAEPVIGASAGYVEIAARSGLFTYISVRILKASRGDPFRLLIFLSILTAVFSAFLDNITAMIIIG